MPYERRLKLSNTDLRAWVYDNYGLEVTIGEIRSGYMSTVIWLEAEDQNYILKIYGAKSIAQIRYGMRVTQHVHRSGLPVAKCLLARQGNELISLKGQQVAVWTFLSGDVFTPGRQGQLDAAGQMLGQFHNTTYSLVDGDTGSSIVERILSELKKTWDFVDDIVLVSEFQERFDAIADTINQNGFCTVIHSDYRAQNLLFNNNNISGILDLDGCYVGPRIFDLSYALAFFQAVIAPDPLSESEMHAFLTAYRREVVLTDAELDSLGAWFSLALLKGMTLWLRIGYIECVHKQARSWIVSYTDFFRQGETIADTLVQGLCGKG